MLRTIIRRNSVATHCGNLRDYLAALTLIALGCASDAPARASARQDTDCLGADSSVAIAPDHIGSLPLNASLGMLQRQCGTLQWTTTNGDESLDTAIILTRPGLRVIGAVATLANEDSEYRPLHIDSSARVQLWKVSGTAAILPNGITIEATWRDLTRAYGPLRAFALNGVVYVTICAIPGIGILMDLPNVNAPINGASPPTVDSVMAASHIQTVTLRTKRQPHIPPEC